MRVLDRLESIKQLAIAGEVAGGGGGWRASGHLQAWSSTASGDI
jgi:hypothetical protein